MPASMVVTERPAARQDAPIPTSAPSGPDAAEDTAVSPSPVRRLWPLAAMVSGLAVVALAATVLIGANDTAPRSNAVAVASAAPDPTAISVSARDISVVTQVYEPGQTSGWHSHRGIHAVAVLSGALTVYDEQCRPTTYEPGRPYVGGQQPHLVRNESEVPVTMAVTYLNPPAPSGSTEQAARPTGCTVG